MEWNLIDNKQLFNESPLSLAVSTNGVDWTEFEDILVIPPHSVYSIEPFSGSKGGNTSVTISGEHFFDSSSLGCRFGGSDIVKAKFVSSTKLICLSPKFVDPDKFTDDSITFLDVTNNGVDFSLSNVTFMYHEPALIHSLSPLFGPSSGGTLVNVTMEIPSSLLNNSNVLCRFNKTIVTGEILSSACVQCKSPAVEAYGGMSIIEISLNGGGDWTCDGLKFVFLRKQRNALVSLVPNHGPLSGGTKVRVEGLAGYPTNYNYWGGPLLDGNVLCKFGGNVIPAISMATDGTFVICKAPPAFPSTHDGGSISVEVELSFNGVIEDFISLGTLFIYDPDVVIAKIEPFVGPVAGQTHVLVEGGPFPNVPDEIFCRFRDKLVKGSWQSSNNILCVTQPMENIIEVQTLSIFSMAWVPEIQSVHLDVDDFVAEIHEISTIGSDSPRGEVQRVQLAVGDVNEVQRVQTKVDLSNKVMCTIDFMIKSKDNEVQTLSTFISSGTIGGTFEIYYGLKRSGPLPSNASASAIQSALSTLDAQWHNIEVIETYKSLLEGTKLWTISFPMISGNIDILQVNGNNLSGEGAGITSKEVQSGSQFEIQTVSVIASSTIFGSFSLTFNGLETDDIAWNASASFMKEALENLPTIGSVNVSRTVHTHPDRIWLQLPSIEQAKMSRFYNTYSWDVTFVTFAGDAPELVPCCDSRSNYFPQTIWSTISNDSIIQVHEKQKGSGEAIDGYFEIFLSNEEGSFSSTPINLKSSAAEVIKILQCIPSLSNDISVDVVTNFVDHENMIPKFQITLESFPEGSVQPIINARVTSCGPSVESTSSIVYVWNDKEVQSITNSHSSLDVVSCHIGHGKGPFSFVTSSTSQTMEGLIEAVIDPETGLSFYGDVEVSEELMNTTSNWVITFLEKAGNLDELVCNSNIHVSTIINGTSLLSIDSKFLLWFGGEESPPINMNATSADVKSALESLSTVDQGSIEVSEEYRGYADFNGGKSWLVTFIGKRFDQDVELMHGSPVSKNTLSAKVDVTEVISGSELQGSFRLKVRNEWSDSIPVFASAREVEDIMRQMDCINYVNITFIYDQKAKLVFDIEFPFYIGEVPNGFIPWSAQNMPPMDVDSKDLKGVALQVTVETLVEGTEPIRNDNYSRGFRLVTPGGSKHYPLTQATRWLQYNESTDGMRRALEDAGGLPRGFSVTRKGPYENGSYKWNIILPKGSSLKNETLWVVNYGGGQVRLQGENASAVVQLGVLATEPAGGMFSLNFLTAKGVEALAIPYNATDEDLKLAIESISEIGYVTVNSKSTDISESGNGARRWDITFSSLQNGGDIPQLEANSFELTGSSAKIVTEENRKGQSNEVMMFHVSRGETFGVASFIIWFKGRPSHNLKHGVSAVVVEEVLNELNDGPGKFYVDRRPIGNDEFEYYFLCSHNNLGFLTEDFAVEVIGYCDHERLSLCSSGTKKAFLLVSKSTEDLGGSFVINFGATCTEVLARRRDGDEFTVICDNATTTDVPVTASALDLEIALESLPSIIDVSVQLTDQSCISCYQIPVTSGVIGETRNFHVSFNEVIHNMTSPDTEFALIDGISSSASRMGVISKGDLPSLKVDESKLIGSRTKDSSIQKEYMALVTELVKGLDIDVSGTVSVEVSINGGHDFSVSGMIFQYLPIAVVSMIIPPHGPINGGTEISVHGDNFEQVSTISCLFWSASNSGNDTLAIYKTSYVSKSLIKCITPPSFWVGDVFVAVSNNGQGALESLDNLRSFSSKFTYYEQTQVNALVPVSGPAKGNFTVQVFGGPFISSGSFHCKFGEAIVIGLFISEQEAACKSPPNHAGIQPFDISMNGYDFTSIGYPFIYHDNVRITEINPKSGPAFAAGTLVRVHGEGFLNSTSTLCRFGDIEVPAIFVNHQLLHCHSPPIDKVNLRWLSLSKQYVCGSHTCDGHLLFSGSHHYPIYQGKIVEVDVTNNGQDFTDNGVSFLYQYDVEIKRVQNSVGPRTGGTPIFVTGLGFVNSTSISCRLGQQIVKAFFLTQESILCFSPSHSHAEIQYPYEANQFRKGQLVMHLRPEGAPNNVFFLEVSNNGVDFSSSGSIFEYRDSGFGGFYQPVVEDVSLFCFSQMYQNDVLMFIIFPD